MVLQLTTRGCLFLLREESYITVFFDISDSFLLSGFSSNYFFPSNNYSFTLVLFRRGQF